MPNDEKYLRRRTLQTLGDMKQRCANPKNSQYKNYGARGIKVCARWAESSANFIADMGIKPPGMSIERIDNDGDYSPENCIWADAKQQAANKKTTIKITHDGVTLCATEWAKRIGRPPKTILSRIRQGWKVSDILDEGLQLRGRCSAPREYAALREQP